MDEDTFECLICERATLYRDRRMIQGYLWCPECVECPPAFNPELSKALHAESTPESLSFRDAIDEFEQNGQAEREAVYAAFGVPPEHIGEIGGNRNG